ncbi:DUF86 domain-containing protein [bacterium]|nr:DUF86 domain-containing protein [bacterium]
MYIRQNDKKHLFDIAVAAEAIEAFTSTLTEAEYIKQEMVQAAVERKFEIIGEALNRIGRQNEELLYQIPDHQRIIGFRNILAHGYDVVDQRLVWDVVKNYLPALRQHVSDLLNE